MKGSFFEAGVEGINDLTSTGKNKILEGDVFATSYGTNKLTLDTTASYLQGNIISEKNLKMMHLTAQIILPFLMEPLGGQSTIIVMVRTA